MDERKKRILKAIVQLYAADGEPIGSNLLCSYLDMAVSSATLRNEMASMTRLGLLEQPHTSAGRVPTTKGYRYYVDDMLVRVNALKPAEQRRIDALFDEVDYDPGKMARDAARGFAEQLQLTVVATTPHTADAYIAHFEVMQIGQYTVAVLGVTSTGGVLTKIVKLDEQPAAQDLQAWNQRLNELLRFVTPGNTPDELPGFDEAGRPVATAALALLRELGKPQAYIEGMQYLLRWPELNVSLAPILELFNDADRLERVIQPYSDRPTIRFGDEMTPAIPDLSIIAHGYVAGGGRTGTIALVGPLRVHFSEVLPRLLYFCGQLGRRMNSSGA